MKKQKKDRDAAFRFTIYRSTKVGAKRYDLLLIYANSKFMFVTTASTTTTTTKAATTTATTLTKSTAYCQSNLP